MKTIATSPILPDPFSPYLAGEAHRPRASQEIIGIVAKVYCAPAIHALRGLAIVVVKEPRRVVRALFHSVHNG